MDINPPYGGRGFGGGGFLTYHEGGPGAIGWTVFALQLLLVLGVAWLLASVVLRGRLGRRAPAAPLAAGGPAGGFGAVIPPWLGHKSRAVTLPVGVCVDCEPPKQ